jgi:6-phosphofructokinase 1
LALQVGTAVGATSIIVPEVEYDFKRDIVDRVMYAKNNGKQHYLIIVAENTCDVNEMAKKLQEETGIDTRATVLGHVQRGGRPTVRDRVMASRMGYAAVELLVKGVGNRVISFTDNKIVDFDIYEALSMERKFDHELYDIAHEISI